ncbi:helix-turn-helix domain-containing protein [Streptomyces sp. NPDC012756]|uniref:helix-turn-helix domain-containing protein n=1 Tax=Streptomyces sp. NPDC012756 TaxID=3364847 RepID=UPI0036B55B2A
MASQHLSAPPPASGLVHVNVRHDTHYVVAGNHLAQHRKLTLEAKGLALYLQSLPTGASVGIKAIAAAHPNSELVVARALRQLEAFGYLKRVRERLPDGRFVHRTISYNRPGAEPKPARTTTPPPPPARKAPPPPPLPLAERHRAAAALLAELRVHDPRLLLSERDVHRLAPEVTAWLDRGAHPDAVRRTLCADLPDPVAHPAALLTHRLRTLLPPQLPTAPPPTPPSGPRFIECDDCGHPFPPPTPDGLCTECRTAARAAA